MSYPFLREKQKNTRTKSSSAISLLGIKLDSLFCSYYQQCDEISFFGRGIGILKQLIIFVYLVKKLCQADLRFTKNYGKLRRYVSPHEQFLRPIVLQKKNDRRSNFF